MVTLKTHAKRRQQKREGLIKSSEEAAINFKTNIQNESKKVQQKVQKEQKKKQKGKS